MDPQVDRDRPIALPPELFRPILQHLSGHTLDLLACSKVSRTICAEAQRILFRIVLDVGDRIVMFLNSVLSSPDRLALHVRVFSPSISPYALKMEHCAILSDAFKVMHNLTHLRLFNYYTSAPDLSLLRDVRFQLESLDLGVSKNEQEVGINFLPNQRSLKYIRLSHWIRINAQGVDLTDAFPNLECIEGPTNVVYALLADRGARAPKTVLLHPSGGDDTTHTSEICDSSGKVAASLRHIEYMTYTTLSEHSGPGQRLLQHMCPLLTSLVVLEVVLLKYSMMDMEMLQHLPKLEHLILSLPSLKRLRRTGRPWLIEHAQRDVQAAAEAFAHSQTVQWVDVKSLRPEDEDCYMRWRRPSLKVPPERIDVHDFSWTVHAHWYRYKGVFSPAEL